MTATTTREPVRTTPREAQSAGSRHTRPDLGAITPDALPKRRGSR